MAAVLKYRRARGLVAYWNGGQAACFSSASARSVPVTADAFAFLDLLGEWTSAGDLAGQIDADPQETDDLLETLAGLSLVDRSDAPAADPLWQSWEPAAAFFHFSTRDVPYSEDRHSRDLALKARAVETPPPPPLKRVEGERILLSRASAPIGDLGEVMKARRTWRSFAPDSIPLDVLGAILDLSCAVQKWGRTDGLGDIPLKTSPSAGARHPIEAYVLAWNVAGLPPGAYHYDAAEHALVDLAKPVSGRTVTSLLAHQHQYAASGAVVVFTAVFEREMWKYPFSRAYRAVLIDAGHLGQTFCLAATALGLAPFCTMAFFETPLEALLGIDGRREAAMYVVGVGARPAGVVNPSLIPGAINGADR